RIAASAGADLYACVGAALATMSGPRHGGECDRFEALVADVGEPRQARAAVAARLQRGDPLHGFGHRLYPAGDPRAAQPLDFALGRTAGWIAHVLEQRQEPALLRPRARYIGR